MKIARRISAPALALLVGLALLAPTSTHAQQTRVIFGSDHGIWIPAADQQLIRVTIGNPHLPDPAGDSHWRESSFSIELTSPAAPVTIGPGESFTYTLDPREVGVLVDSATGQRHVLVGARISKIVIDSNNPSGPQPALLVELLNRKTGRLESFHTFPGFSGGVYVAAGDVN